MDTGAHHSTADMPVNTAASRWCHLSPQREASVICAKKFHTDGFNLPRIQASLLNGSLYETQLKNIQQLISQLMLSAILTQTKLIRLIIQEVQ